MRIHKLTPIIVSLVVLGVITAALVRYRSVGAQDCAAKAPITAKAALQQTQGGGFNPVPAPETTSESDTDLFLDADEVEKRAVAEQASDTTSAAVIANPTGRNRQLRPEIDAADQRRTDLDRGSWWRTLYSDQRRRRRTEQGLRLERLRRRAAE
jgi:hypothetical protein